MDGIRWSEQQSQDKVIAAVGAGARLVRDEDVRCFDILPLLVAATRLKSSIRTATLTIPPTGAPA